MLENNDIDKGKYPIFKSVIQEIPLKGDKTFGLLKLQKEMKNKVLLLHNRKKAESENFSSLNKEEKTFLDKITKDWVKKVQSMRKPSNEYYSSNYSRSSHSKTNNFPLGLESLSPKANCERSDTALNGTAKAPLVLQHNKSEFIKSRNTYSSFISRSQTSLKSINKCGNAENRETSPYSSITGTNRECNSVLKDHIKTVIDVNTLLSIFNSSIEIQKEISLYDYVTSVLNVLTKLDKQFNTVLKKVQDNWTSEKSYIKYIHEENERLREQLLFYENKFESIKQSLNDKYCIEKEELKGRIVSLEETIRKLETNKKSIDFTTSEIKNTHQSIEISIYNPKHLDNQVKNLPIPKLDLGLLTLSDKENTGQAFPSMHNSTALGDKGTNKYKRVSTSRNTKVVENTQSTDSNFKPDPKSFQAIKKGADQKVQQIKINNSNILKIIKHKRNLTESKLFDLLTTPPVMVRTNLGQKKTTNTDNQVTK